MRIDERPSPNRENRPAGAKVDFLILHYTGMQNAEEALERLCDPQAKVSAHYCIEETGRVWRLVDETLRAWHAGLAYWDGLHDINSRSIGIELVNPGHEFGYRAFPESQIETLIALCREIVTRHPIAPGRVLGHSDIAPLRKRDPGEFFPWRRLAAAGIGLWWDSPRKSERPLADLLGELGYGYLGEDRRGVFTAFQRHWRPEAVTGTEDEECRARAAALLHRVQMSQA